MQGRSTSDEATRLRADLHQLLHAAGHDLAEPARTVRGFLDLLERRHAAALPADAQDYIAFARDAAERLEAMLAALLELGRIGQAEQWAGEVDLRTVAGEAAGKLRKRFDEVAATVTIGELPAATGDPRLWRRLFGLLLENALTFRSGAPLSVRIFAEGNSIRVADNGSGIDPAFRERVLEPFQRLHPRDVIPGTGMGLTIAKRIAEHHGGTLHVEGADGPGHEPGVVVVIGLAERRADATVLAAG